MKISSTLSKNEIEELLEKFYKYFEDPRDFELFLKYYLLKMGLDEVQTTRYVRDGGIDLIAIRKGFGDFSESDITKYYVQAKRYKHDSTIGSRTINELKGNIPFGGKGIFITTSKFSKEAEKISNNDPSKPVVLVDGISLINSCIDNEIGFIYKPVFSSYEMDMFTKKEEKVLYSIQNLTKNEEKNTIEKLITKNDIKARIISVPAEIVKEGKLKDGNINVTVNGKLYKNITYKNYEKHHRKYLASVTQIFKDFSLLSEDNIENPKMCKWVLKDTGNIELVIPE